MISTHNELQEILKGKRLFPPVHRFILIALRFPNKSSNFIEMVLMDKTGEMFYYVAGLRPPTMNNPNGGIGFKFKKDPALINQLIQRYNVSYISDKNVLKPENKATLFLKNIFSKGQGSLADRLLYVGPILKISFIFKRDKINPIGPVFKTDIIFDIIDFVSRKYIAKNFLRMGQVFSLLMRTVQNVYFNVKYSLSQEIIRFSQSKTKDKPLSSYLISKQITKFSQLQKGQNPLSSYSPEFLK